MSSECPLHRACVNNKCADPCPGTCGYNARCNVVNHIPICSCVKNYTGDPFNGCKVLESKNLISVLMPLILFFMHPKICFSAPVSKPESLCLPSPCGPNSDCRIIGTQAACSCLSNYIGRPPNCRPECSTNAECSSNLSCINEKCQDPCPGSCGVNTSCSVLNHNSICVCIFGYDGDPTLQCSEIPACMNLFE